jgi:DNA-binding IclR family transcriptional regulator
VLQDVGVLTVMSESPPHAVQAVNWVGRVVSVAGASAGYALLLDHERGELARFGDPGALWRRIRDARTRGFALVDEEFEPGLVAVGAPVRDFRGRIVAAVNVSAPKFRFGARLEQAGEEVRAVADDLSRSLGWTP